MSKPVRLGKTDDHSFNSIFGRIEKWAYRNAHILLPIFIILGLIVFVALCFLICGASATESGLQYNQFDKII